MKRSTQMSNMFGNKKQKLDEDKEEVVKRESAAITKNNSQICLSHDRVIDKEDKEYNNYRIDKEIKMHYMAIRELRKQKKE